MRENLTNILWGIILIILGILFALLSFDLVDIDLFFNGWWTLLIIIPSLLSLLKHGYRTGSMIGIFIGIMLLLSSRGMIESKLIKELTVPFIIIYLGISMLLRNILFQSKYTTIQRCTTPHSFFQLFSSSHKNYDAMKFEGADITTIFASFQLNLNNSTMNEDVIISCTTLFGGTDLQLPSNVNVQISNFSIFGGVENKYRPIYDRNLPTIFINATCLFGGVNIK